MTTFYGIPVSALCVLVPMIGLGGCLEDSTRGPQTVIETGYLSCEIDANSCGANAAACVDGDAVSACVEVPVVCDGHLTCACFGTAACGSRTCTDSADGISLTCADIPEPDPNACTPGASFEADDGCNTCQCPASGRRDEAACTLLGCVNVTCEDCLAGGGTWQPEAGQCTVDCAIQDISCFESACPGACEDRCGDCFSEDACEAQDCQWNQEAEATWCSEPFPSGGCGALITSEQGDFVVPGTTLNLSGALNPAGTPTGTFTWSVEQPVGSQSVFVPSATVVDPTFEVGVPGVYVFRLEATDANGASCEAATYQVTVDDG